MASPWKKNYSRYRSYFVNTLVHYKKRDDARAYLELLLTSVAIIVFAVFALKPTLTTIGVLSQEISDKEETLGVLNEKIDKLNTAQELLANNEASIKKLDVSIPYLTDSVDLVRQIEGLTVKSEVYVSFFSINQAPLFSNDLESNLTGSNISEDSLSFRVGLVGRYKDIVAFIDSVQNLRRPVVIDAAKIEVVNDSAYLTATLDMHVPYLNLGNNQNENIQ